MRFLLLILVLAHPGWSGSPGRNPEHDTNVNSRYVVEIVEVAPEFLAKLSEPLRDRIQKIAGAHFDQEALEDLTRRIRKELRSRIVVMKVTRGTKPDHIKVAFEIKKSKGGQEIAVPRMIYHSKQNFSFGVDADWNTGDFLLGVAALTDNDRLVERYSGFQGSISRQNLAGRHLNVGVEAATWRSQWNPAVMSALNEAEDVPGTYRTRVHFQPSATIKFMEPLTLQLGVGIERLNMQYPAARTELSSAAFSTLRFRRRWELTPVNRHELNASYSIRSATRSLNSDFVYTRHFAELRYGWRGAREEIIGSVQTGSIYGTAPLFERFTLGNSDTLRGWNKYDVDPLGGERMVHGSLDYRYRWVRLVYDTGSSWRRGGPVKVLHSLAFGITKDGPTGFSAMVAFPLREGRVEPIFVTGLNF